MKSVLKVVDQGIHRMLTCAGMISVLLMVMLAVFIFAQAFSRYVLSSHIPGLFDISIYSLVLFTFLSGAHTSPWTWYGRIFQSLPVQASIWPRELQGCCSPRPWHGFPGAGRSWRFHQAS